MGNNVLKNIKNNKDADEAFVKKNRNIKKNFVSSHTYYIFRWCHCISCNSSIFGISCNSHKICFINVFCLEKASQNLQYNAEKENKK